MKTVYLVVYTDYDVYSIEGSYEHREHAETHLELAEEINSKNYLTIEEIEVADGPPRIVYSAEITRGVRRVGGFFVGFAGPAQLTALPPEQGGDVYASAWGYSQDEAEAALDAILLENGVS